MFLLCIDVKIAGQLIVIKKKNTITIIIITFQENVEDKEMDYSCSLCNDRS